jgi:Ca2+-binding EF-hand superfamily protein
MLKVYQELFTRFDRDGSDSVDPAELGNALRFIGCNPIDAEIDSMIQEAGDKGNEVLQAAVLNVLVA